MKRLKKINLDEFGFLNLIFRKKKKQVPQFFPLFAKKARSSLDIKLEKFVYTKTHLADKQS